MLNIYRIRVTKLRVVRITKVRISLRDFEIYIETCENCFFSKEHRVLRTSTRRVGSELRSLKVSALTTLYGRSYTKYYIPRAGLSPSNYYVK
ncbi:hypothetical protein PUN28_019062 [Cardiocondyla obscurior]|uniref:Ribosomal protein S14 n=1 Tax=Cardiocondyla obscurior TaxID=286306 RepID=A0AAW2EF94_9HYME